MGPGWGPGVSKVAHGRPSFDSWYYSNCQYVNEQRVSHLSIPHAVQAGAAGRKTSKVVLASSDVSHTNEEGRVGVEGHSGLGRCSAVRFDQRV